MSVASLGEHATDQVESILRSIRIPPRPTLLANIQGEVASGDPDPIRIGKMIGTDPGASAALLKLANSALYGARRKSASVDQAISYLGTTQCVALVTGILAKQAVDNADPSLQVFWDVSAKRAQVMVFLARHLAVTKSDVAHTFGLFCDIGVPLMMQRFPEYRDTYTAASLDAENPFVAIEDARFNSNHAAVGCLLARNWGLPQEVSLAILQHHDYSIMTDSFTDDGIRSLVAMCVLAEYVIGRYQGRDISAEWCKGGGVSCAHLGVTEDDLSEICEVAHEKFVD